MSVGGHKVVATVVAEGPDRVSIQKPASFKCRMGTGGAGKPAVVYSVVGLEVGTEAPSFAVLAANDGAGDQVRRGGGRQGEGEREGGCDDGGSHDERANANVGSVVERMLRAAW